jgi:hypothetical protein
MNKMDRRDFIKTLTFGGAVLGLGGIFFHKPLEALAGGKHDIGQCKSLRIKCVSELGWLDNSKLIGSIKAAGYGSPHCQDKLLTRLSYDLSSLFSSFDSVKYENRWNLFYDPKYIDAGVR